MFLVHLHETANSLTKQLRKLRNTSFSWVPSMDTFRSVVECGAPSFDEVYVRVLEEAS